MERIVWVACVRGRNVSLDLSTPYCGMKRNFLVCGVVWRKDTMGLVCLAEGYDGTGVSAVGTSSSVAIIVAGHQEDANECALLKLRCVPTTFLRSNLYWTFRQNILPPSLW